MNIIIYVIDSLRTDHLSCYGYDRQTSKNIDKIAQDGVVFDRCYTPSTWTRPVAASLLTGLYPSVHRVETRKDKFPLTIPTLPGLLKELDFNTACISAMGNVSTATGFAQGFDYFLDLYKDPALLSSRPVRSSSSEGLELEAENDIVFPLAEDLNSHLFHWLDDKIGQKNFMLLWSIQPHAPYDPPEEFLKFVSLNYDNRFKNRRDMVRLVKSELDRQYLIDLYDSEIYYNDHCIGELISYLKDAGIYNDSLLIILSDHGEAFGEHGIYSHGHLPYDEVMRVPMVIKFPHNQFAGMRFQQDVTLIDIFSTLLDYVNHSKLDKKASIVKGKSFLDLLNGGRTKHHQQIICETNYSDTKPKFYSIRTKDWKLIKVDKPPLQSKNLINIFKRILNENLLKSILTNPLWMLKRYGRLEDQSLFNIHNDPGETQNLISDQPEVAENLRNQLEEWRTACKAEATTYLTRELTVEEDSILTQHLENLGYLD